jgi:glycosyltransferase involved in cell wall biosynthesis
MKILFVQHMNAISGSELYLLQLLPELKKKGIEVEMLIAYKTDTGMNTPFVEQLTGNGVKVHTIYGHSPYSWALIRKIKRITKEGKFDIVQSNLIHADLWMALVKFFYLRKMKLLSVKHGFDEGYAAKYGFNTKKLNRSLFVWVQRLSGIVTNRNITISKGIYDLYVTGKISKKRKTAIVYYGLGLGHIRNSGFERTDQNRYAIILGRLVKYKGHEYVIRAWKKVKGQDPSLKLYIVGRGSYQETLVQLTAELGLQEQVIFCGYQPNPHQLLHFSEFSVVSSIFEGFGLITLESWHHHRPVIAFDVPALCEVIDDNENGMLVTPFDTDELADKISRMFNDTAATKRMGENGFEKLQRAYSLDRMTNEMIDVYNHL